MQYLRAMPSISRKFSALALLSLVACADSSSDGPISWDEFQSRAAYDPISATYVYDGDQTALDLVDLGRAYDAYRANFASDTGEVSQELIVNKVNGVADKWPDAMSVTYCVSQKSFGSNYNAAVAAVEGALDDWKATGAKINYTHVTSADGNCTNRTNVSFNVRQDMSTQYYAKAFFPYYPRRSREVVISTISYNPANLGPWTLRGILRHELGHSLGFRHEHIRPEAPRVSPCSAEDTNWIVLTPYDSASVMHYPHNGCNGTNTGDLAITSLDAQGARALYP